MHTLPWMGTHMAWQVGDGENILLGIDPIVGSQSSFSLLEDLRSYLEDMNICTLSQAQNSLHNAQSYWLTADDLDLGGSYKITWNAYIEGLSGAGICLTNRLDELVWDYKKKSGSITAKNAYECIVFSLSPPAANLADSLLWTKALPNKISCFIWLSIWNRNPHPGESTEKGKTRPWYMLSLLFERGDSQALILHLHCLENGR